MLGGNQQRRDAGADEAQRGERRPVQRSERQREEADRAEREKGESRANEAIERVGGIEAAERGDDAGGGERRGRAGKQFFG